MNFVGPLELPSKLAVKHYMGPTLVTIGNEAETGVFTTVLDTSLIQEVIKYQTGLCHA